MGFSFSPFRRAMAGAALIAGALGFAQTGLADFNEEVANAERRSGLFDIYLDRQGGRLLAAFPEADVDGLSLRFIYGAQLRAGLGSNPIGLDRGAWAGPSIVSVRKVGKKVFFPSLPISTTLPFCTACRVERDSTREETPVN